MAARRSPAARLTSITAALDALACEIAAQPDIADGLLTLAAPLDIIQQAAIAIDAALERAELREAT